MLYKVFFFFFNINSKISSYMHIRLAHCISWVIHCLNKVVNSSLTTHVRLKHILQNRLITEEYYPSLKYNLSILRRLSGLKRYLESTCTAYSDIVLAGVPLLLSPVGCVTSYFYSRIFFIIGLVILHPFCAYVSIRYLQHSYRTSPSMRQIVNTLSSPAGNRLNLFASQTLSQSP